MDYGDDAWRERMIAKHERDVTVIMTARIRVTVRADVEYDEDGSPWIDIGEVEALAIDSDPSDVEIYDQELIDWEVE